MSGGGITDAGFVAETVETITQDTAAELAIFVPGIDLSPTGPLGQIVGIYATREARLWELASALYDSRDPDKASGPLLAGLCAITGTVPVNPTPSTVGVNLSASKIVNVAPGAYKIQAPGADVAWSNRDAIVTTGSATLASVVFVASVTGPTSAVANSLTQVNAPVDGLSVTGNTVAVPGKARESDADLKVRRVAELTRLGGSTDDAIAEALTDAETGVPGVLYADTFSNYGSSVDALGTPAGAFQVVYWDGTDAAADVGLVAQAIRDNQPAGVQDYGTSAAYATDKKGRSRLVHFTRVTEVPLHVAITVRVTSAFPADGVAQVKAALVAEAAATLGVGTSVIAQEFIAPARAVAGVNKVTTLSTSTGPTPTTDADIAVTPVQIATLIAANIVVTTAAA